MIKKILARPSILCLLAMTSSLAAAAAGSPQATLTDDQYTLTVTNPALDGLEVGQGMVVRGTADLPPGYHLWVFARRTDFEGVWWPQNECRISPRTGEWLHYANFGGIQDVGWEFDLAIAIFDDAAHTRLKTYRRAAVRTNDWKPIPMPAAATPPKLYQVLKVSHD